MRKNKWFYILIILFMLISSCCSVAANEVETSLEDTPTILNLEDEDFTNGSLVVTHAMYKNYDTPYPMISNETFTNGLTIMGKYENISFGSFTTNSDLSDRVCIKFSDGKKMFSKGSNLTVDITNIRNYIEETDSTRHYWSMNTYKYSRVYFRDINGDYQHVNVRDDNIVKFDGGGFYSISLEVTEVPFDVYEIYVETIYQMNAYQNVSSLIGTSNRFHRFGGFSDSKISIVETLPDETKGLLSGIIEWIKSILQAIIDLPSNIANLFSEMFNWILNALQSLGNFLAECITSLGNFIINGLKELFIPDSDYFSDLFTDLHDFFKDKLGFLVFPFELMGIIIEKFLDIGNGNGYLSIPEVSVLGFTIIQESVFDLGYWMRTTLGEYYDFYFAFVDTIIILLFVNFTKKRFDILVNKGD